MVKLETDRLILREWSEKDKQDLIKSINNLNVTKNLSIVPHPYTRKDANYWIKKCKEHQKEKPRKKIELAIELKSEKKLIGGIGLIDIDKFNEMSEVGCWLNEKYWRQGIMHEATNLIINYAFKDLKLRRLHLNIYSENTASNNLAKKSGFVYEGTRKKYVKDKATGKIHDVNIYRLLKTEWRSKK